MTPCCCSQAGCWLAEQMKTVLFTSAVDFHTLMYFQHVSWAGSNKINKHLRTNDQKMLGVCYKINQGVRTRLERKSNDIMWQQSPKTKTEPPNNPNAKRKSSTTSPPEPPPHTKSPDTPPSSPARFALRPGRHPVSEWSGVEWSGVESSRVESSRVEWSGVEWSGVE